MRKERMRKERKKGRKKEIKKERKEEGERKKTKFENGGKKEVGQTSASV